MGPDLPQMDPVVVLATDHQGQCTFLSGVWRTLSGHSVRDSLGLGWLEAVHPDERERVAAAWKDATRRREPHAEEFRLQRPDGEQRWVIMAAQPLRERWVGTVVDISDSRPSDEEVVALRQRLKAVVGGLPIVLWEVDPEGCFTLSEGLALNPLGLSPGEAVGQSVFELYADVPEVVDAHRRALRGEDVTYGAQVDGRQFACRAMPRSGADGAFAGMLGVAWDVSEQQEGHRDREKLESELAQSRRLESVGRLAGGVAHDLNNLLAVILNYAEFVLEQTNQESVRHDALQIRSAADRAAALVRQLLIFSRREAARPEVFDVTTLIDELEQLFSRTLGEQVDLRTLRPDGPLAMLADRGQIEQAIVNLVMNARDAMPDGGRLELTARRLGRNIEVAVRDHGDGRSEHSDLDRATVYGIVEAAGGRVEIETALGVGTRVRLLLPASEEAPTEPPPQAGARPAGDVLDPSATVLVVEDEPAVLELTRRILSEHGYTVLIATDVEEATQISDSHPGDIDLLLTDVVLPGRDGLELPDRVRGRYPGAAVIFMSGYPGDSAVEAAVSSHGAETMAKPFRPQELLERVRDALQRA